MTAQPLSTRRERIAWYLYDFGNSAYASVVLLAVFSAYFQKQVVGGAEGTRLWGAAILIAMLVVAVTAPILGTIADFSGSKKKFLLAYTALACVFTAGLFFATQGQIVLGMAFFILAEIGYRSAQVFYDALLPEIAAPTEMGRIAGLGWAIGSAGGIVILLLVLPMILLTTNSPNADLFIRLSLVVTAIFFAVSALPLFFWLKERAQPQPLPQGKNYFNVAFERIGKTIRTAGGFGEFLKFMLAYLVFNDGAMMALDFAAIIGAVLYGMQQQDLIIFVILVQATNVAGAYLFGHLVDRIGGKSSLSASLGLMIAITLGLYLNQSPAMFYVIGALGGFAMAGIQSVSRTMVGLFAPRGASGEFYGFFALAGRTSSFIGPGLYGFLAAEAALYFQAQDQDATLAEQNGQRIAILSIAAFLFVGLLLLLWVNEKKARAMAKTMSAARGASETIVVVGH
ncbi:MAG: MFS transporter [Chloroflexi bacterium]|nr:MFS transporter [Chloroflexota bacterium]